MQSPEIPNSPVACQGQCQNLETLQSQKMRSSSAERSTGYKKWDRKLIPSNCRYQGDMQSLLHHIACLYGSLMSCSSYSHTQVPVTNEQKLLYLSFDFYFIFQLHFLHNHIDCFLYMFCLCGWGFNILTTTGYSLVIYVAFMPLYLCYNLVAATTTEMTFVF